jgi:RNA polymerase sigma factor (sigma-70 family)
MSSAADLTKVIRHLQPAGGEGPSDPELLDRYTLGRDQDAFATLVHRYGPLVLGVAQRQLADRHRAEDVFQATFLALARSAAKLGRKPTLANWLYTVALRQARKARGRDARRGALELAAATHPQTGTDPLDEITAREFLCIIDDEIVRLPERLRLPVLLCGVQGLSRDEAARRLGWSEGAVKGRLERGRRRLAARLAARGLAPSALFLAPLVAASVPSDLLARSAEQAAAPWSKSIPLAIVALARAAAPRALFPTAAIAGGVLVVALAGWVVAAGGPSPADPPPTAAMPPVAAKPAPDDPLPAGAVRRFGSPRFRHPTEIEGLFVTADGKLAFAHSGLRSNGSIRAYDLATGHALRDFNQGGTDAHAVALPPDGKTLAIKVDFSVVLRDAASGAETGRVHYPKANPYSTADLLFFTPDGTRVIVGTGDGKGMHLIRMATGEIVHTFPMAGTIFAAALSPDGKRFVAGGYDYENGGGAIARQWEVETGRELNTLALGKEWIRSAAYSPDGRTIAIGGEWGKASPVYLIEAATGQQRLRIPFPEGGSIKSVAFAPDGKTVAASGRSSTRLFDVASGNERLKIDRRAIGLRFSPDGATLTGAVAGTIYRWETASGKSLIPEGGDSVVSQIAVSADGKRLISLGHDGDGHVWDARTGEYRRRVKMGYGSGFALTPDGRYLIWPETDESVRFQRPDDGNSIHYGSRLRMLDLESGAMVERFGPFEGSPSGLVLIDGGKSLVTIDYWRRDANVWVWDVASGKALRKFLAEGKPQSRVSRTRLSPDGKLLAVQYQAQGRGLRVDTDIKLWDLATGKEVGGPTPAWFEDPMESAPDGKTKAVLQGGGRSIQLHDGATGQLLKEFVSPTERMTTLAFGADGRLYSGTVEGTVLAWDPNAAAK